LLVVFDCRPMYTKVEEATRRKSAGRNRTFVVELKQRIFHGFGQAIGGCTQGIAETRKCYNNSFVSGLLVPVVI